MSFNKKTIIITFVIILAAFMAGCSGQTVAPTATVAPTVEEPTAVPTEAAEEPAAEVIKEAAAETVVEEAETTEAATEEKAETDAVETVVEEAVTTEAETEEKAEAGAAETVAEEAESTEAETEEKAEADTVETVAEEAKTTEAETEEKAEADTAVTVAEEAETTEAATEEKAEADTAETTVAEEAVVAVFENDGSYVASVDDEGVSMDDFVQMTTFNRYQYLNQYYQYAQMYSMYGLPLDSLDEQMVSILGEDGKERLGSEAIDQLTYNIVLHKEAKEAGVEFSEEEIYSQLKTMFGYEDPEPEAEGPMGMESFVVDPMATDTEDDKNAAFRTYAQNILDMNYGGVVSFDFLKDYAYNILLDNTMFASELEQRTFEAEMVNARHILVADEETAKDILARLEAGEEWAALASENSLDTANKDNSGSLGWFGRGEMVTEFENAAFALEPGEISEPVQTNYGFHIIASDGKEIRPLSGSALEAAQNAAYSEWAVSLRNKHNIQSYPEIWLDAVPMEPAFTSSAAVQETAEVTAAEEAVVEEPAEETVETEAAAEEPAEETVETEAAVEEPVEETAETEAAVEEPVEETAETEAAVEEPAEEAVKTEAAVEEPTEEAVVAETAVEEPVEETASVSAVSENFAEDVVKSDVVAMVDDAEIKADDFVAMTVFNRYQILTSYNQYAQYYAMFGLPLDEINAYYENLMGENGKHELGESTINQLAYFKMLEKEAAEMGITASNKEAVEQMKINFGYEQESTEAEDSLGLDSFNLEEELLAEDDEDGLRDYIEMDLAVAFNDQISYEFLREYIRHGILENKVVEDLLEGLVFEEEMVNARHILVEEEDTAKELLERLNDGEEWDALAAEYSIDTSNKDQGGDLGWFGRDMMVSEFEDAAFALEPGEISEPIKTSFGWHIIASDGKEIRPMEAEALEAAQSEVYDEWYNSLLKKYNTVSYPEVWLPLVPLEPVFEPIVIDANAENPEIPTFHIVSDEDETGESAESGTESETVSDEEELSIKNTEQDPDEIGIQNTEQEAVAYTINNDAENK